MRAVVVLLLSGLALAAEVERRNETETTTASSDAAPEASEADLHAAGAEKAAAAAQRAANVAHQVATHAQKVHAHAQEALKHAHGALTDARKDTEGLTEGQKDSLKKADSELTAATEKLETEELEQSEWVQDALAENEAKAQSAAATEQLRQQVQELEQRVQAAQAADAVADKEMYEKELSKLKKQLSKQLAAEGQEKGTAESLGKMKDELENMERQVDTMQDIKDLKEKIEGHTVDTAEEQKKAKEEEAELRKQLQDLDGLVKKLEDEANKGAEVEPVTMKDLEEELRRLKEAVAERIQREKEKMEAQAKAAEAAAAAAAAAKKKKKKKVRKHEPAEIGADMPYGELEAFGREDTAQELTDASIQESDKMVDQIERAEVAEEKRSVFRALTRLRGAAITSYDGVARSQTGNIDEYNHKNKWRDAHPLHHLADEESDVSHWAFPDNAD